MPNPFRDDTQFPKRITLPTLGSQVPQGYNFGTFASQMPQIPFRLPPPQFTGYSVPPPQMQNATWETMQRALANQPNTPQTTPSGGMSPQGFNALFSAQNPFLQKMGGVVGAGLRMPPQGTNPFGGGGQGGAPRLSPIEAYARERIDKALGAGTYDRYLKATGQSILQKFRDNPRHLYWDEPNSPEGAINSYIRDEMNNARNAAQWQQEHGNIPIPQEMWDRWYYANRQGQRPDDVQRDGNEVVY